MSAGLALSEDQGEGQFLASCSFWWLPKCITGTSASGHTVPVSHDCIEVTSITKVISLQEP